MADRIRISQPVFVTSALNVRPSVVASTPNPTRFSISVNELGAKAENAQNFHKKEANRTSLESKYLRTNGPLPSHIGLDSSANEIKFYGNRPVGNFHNAPLRRIYIQPLLPQPINYPILCERDTSDNLCLNQKEKICQFPQFPSDKNNKDHGFQEKRLFLGETGLLSKQNKQDNLSEKNPSMRSVGKFPPSPSLQHSRRKQERPLKSVKFEDKENKNPEIVDKPSSFDNVSGLKSDATKIHRNIATKQKLLPKEVLVKSNPPLSPISLNGRGSNNDTLNNSSLSEKAKSTVLHPNGSNVKNIQGLVRSLHPQMMSSLYSYGRSSLQNPKYSGPLPKHNYAGPYPLPYRRMGTATRSNPLSLKKCRVIYPQQVKTVCSLTANANRANVNTTASTSTTHLLAVPPDCPSRPVESVGRRESPYPLTVRKTMDSSVQSLVNIPSCQNRTSQPTSQNSNSLNPLILVLSDTTNKSDASSQKQSENANGSKAYVQKNFNQEGKKGTNKIQETQVILTKISQLLVSIDRTLTAGFECSGLEASLPIWKLELEQCILSVEKIKSTLIKYQDKIKQ